MTLSINGLILTPYIGCLEEEKRAPQKIEVDVHITCETPAPLTDSIEEAICYARCVQTLRDESRKKHFHLIEHLAYCLHQALKSHLPLKAHVTVRVTKRHPDFQDVTGGVSFTYSSCEK